MDMGSAGDIMWCVEGKDGETVGCMGGGEVWGDHVCGLGPDLGLEPLELELLPLLLAGQNQTWSQHILVPWEAVDSGEQLAGAKGASGGGEGCRGGAI